MAIDREASRGAEAGHASGRIYAWDGAWVSLGRFQRPENALLDPQFDRFVMRPTGGKAVLHGADLTVCLAIPLANLRLDARDVKSAYRRLIRPLIITLRECGLPAVLAEETVHLGKGHRVADCFAFNSPNDVVHEETGVKVCGCALRISDRAVLLQASIPVRPYLVAPEAVLAGGVHLPVSAWRQEEFADAFTFALKRI